MQGDVERQLTLLERRFTRGTSDSALLVAELEQKVVGVARVAYFEPGEDAPRNAAPPGWYLLGVNVAPAFRRRGIGTALTLERLEIVLRYASVAWFFTDASNRASIALHEALGFQPQSRDFWFPTVSFSNDQGILFSLCLPR